MSSQAIKIGLSAAVILGAGGYLMAETMADPEALTYFHPVDEVIHNPTAFSGKKIRMGGHVAEKSIFQKKGTLEYQFDVKPVPGMAKHPELLDKTFTVRYTGVVPDTFKDDGNSEVIVTGEIGADGVFHATDLLAKCPSKEYVGEKRNEKPKY